MKLREPELKSVWPGPPSADKPYGETRLLRDEVLTVADVTRAVTDGHYRRSKNYSAGDISLLWRALGQYPGNRKRRGLRSEHPPGFKPEY